MGAMFAARTVDQLARLLFDGDGGPEAAGIPQVRPVLPGDIAAICRLLDEGFIRDGGPRVSWREIFEYRWRKHGSDLGFVLIDRQEIVGFLGLIYSERPLDSGGRATICNLTSWYVRPSYRGWGALLLRAAIGREDVTFTSLTPGVETSSMLQALRFDVLPKRRFFLPLGHLKTWRMRGPSIAFDPGVVRGSLSAPHQRIFDDHQPHGVMQLLVRDGAEQAYAVVKRRTVSKAFGALPISLRVPYSEILYCSSPELLVRHLERVKLAILARQGTLALAADESIIPPSVKASAVSKSDRFALSRQPEPPALDLLYSELVLLPI